MRTMTKRLFRIGGHSLLLVAWIFSACGGAPDAAAPASSALSIQDLDGSVAPRIMRPPGAGSGSRERAPLTGSPTNNLSYHGGTGGIGVETAPLVYLVFWGSQWSSDPSGEVAVLRNFFFSNVGGSAWNETVTQYCQGVASGTTSCSGSGQAAGNPAPGVLAGSWYDNGSSAPSQPTQSQIAGEAVRAAAYFGRTTAASNANVQYFIATAHNNNSAGFGSTYCAYHSWTSSAYGNIAYTNMPYNTDSANCGANFNGLGPNAGITIVAGHEFAETETDPFPSSGWLDGNGAEIGDKCAWISSGQGAVANVALGNMMFPMQSLWSNAFQGGAGGCVIGSGAQAPLYSGVGPGLCLDVPAFSTTPGTLLQTWTCTGGANQEWIFVHTGASPSGALGDLRSALAPDLCLEVPGSSITPGTQVQTGTCNGGANQEWFFVPDLAFTTDTGELHSALASDLCLDVPGSSTTPGTQVQIGTCNGGASQKWRRTDDGRYVSALGSGLCLDVRSDSATPGTPVQTWNCTGGINQFWY